MPEIHDLQLQVRAIRQCLSQDKGKIGFLVGAGCPVSIKIQREGEASKTALIPDIAGLTAIVSRRLTERPETKQMFEALRRQLSDNFNIEQCLSQVRGLQQIAGNDTVRGLAAADLLTLETAICNEIYELTNCELPKPETAYGRMARWLKALRRTEPVDVFTTNYDLLLEEALDEAAVPYFDGFIGSFRPSFDPYAMEEDRLPPRWARLWKLHGSINWALRADGAVKRLDPSLIQPGERRLIHPSHLKYDESHRMPYLAMIDKLKHFLRQPSSILVTVGFSFRDVHLNEVVQQGLIGNPRSHTFALVYSGIARHPEAARIARVCPNLTLLSWDAAIIGGKDGGYPETDREKPAAEAAIAWEEKDPQVPPQSRTYVARCRLGDFEAFGKLFDELITGQSALSVEAQN